ncbi:MAG: hypothetical protein RI567_13925, partial [Marinobacter sp.]|nr:hypothetical protein [Marinobacter sp.]
MNRLLRYLITTLALSVMTASVHADNEDEPLIKAFSEMTSLEDGWEPMEFPKIDRHSQYQLVEENDEQVVKATT